MQSMSRLLLAVVVLLVVSTSCSNSSPESAALSDVPTTTSNSSLPVATFLGDQCVGSCDLSDARHVTFDGNNYVADRKIGYGKLGDVIASAEGSAVARVEVRQIEGTDPEIAFAVTGDGLNAVRYHQVQRFERSGPAIVRLSPEDIDIHKTTGPMMAFNGTVIIEDECLYVIVDTWSWIDESPLRALMVWPEGSSWDDSRRQLELHDGTAVRGGSEVLGASFGTATMLPAAVLDGCSDYGERVLTFRFVEEQK